MLVEINRQGAKERLAELLAGRHEEAPNATEGRGLLRSVWGHSVEKSQAAKLWDSSVSANRAIPRTR